MLIFFFFFFQAEDGIRDADVTGVQTCALPISPGRASSRRSAKRHRPASRHRLTLERAIHRRHRAGGYRAPRRGRMGERSHRWSPTGKKVVNTWRKSPVTPGRTRYARRSVPACEDRRPQRWRTSLATCPRSEEHTSELQSRPHLVCRLLLEKK